LLTQANTVEVSDGSVGAIRAQKVALNSSNPGIIICDEIEASSINSFVTIARQVNGNVETTLDQRSAAIFGILAGVFLGLVAGALRYLTRSR